MHRFSEAEGVRWHWVEAGAGDPVVLLHGMPGTWHSWAGVIPELAGEYRVLAFDLKGFGRSEAGAGDYSAAGVAAQLLDVLEREEVTPFRLVGHDWGGLVGARLAGEVPDKVEAYVHVAAPGDVYDLTRLPDYRDFWLDPDEAPRFLEIADLVVARAYDQGVPGGKEALPEELVQRRIEDFGRAGGARSLAHWFRDLELDESWRLGPRWRASWEQMSMPVLFVVGARDLLTPSETVLGLERRVSGPVRLRMIDDAGHFPHEERPDAVARVLLRFFAGRP